MKNLLKAEFYYLFKNIRYYVFIALVAAGYIATFISKISFLPPIMTLVSIVFCAIIILEFSHKDFTHKTMKNYVGCGTPLWKVYFAKYIICLAAIAILIIMSSILTPFAEVVCGSKTMSQLSFEYILVGIIVELIQATVVFFFCSFIRSGVLSILIAILYTVIAPFVLSFAKNANDIVAAIYPYLSFSIQEQMTKTDTASLLSTAMTDPNMADQLTASAAHLTPEIFLHLCVPIVVAIALTCLGSFLYSLREVK